MAVAPHGQVEQMFLSAKEPADRNVCPTDSRQNPGSLFQAKIRELFALDLRSLATFRIGVALLLLVDLAIRATALEAHYTDLGVLPRSALGSSPFSSLHLLSGSAWYQAVLFIVAGLVAMALLVGFRTWWATFFSWVLLLSLHTRNPIVLQGGDDFLRLLLFWGLFLPLGARWSLDSAEWHAFAARRGWPFTSGHAEPRKHGTQARNSVVTAGTVAFLFQVCFVYWFSAALKTDPAWRSEGTAVYYALSIEQFATPLGKVLLGYPELLKVLTFASIGLEAFGPLLLFIPFFTGPLRLGVVTAFLLFHTGLGLCMELGPFPYICGVAWLALLPSWFWDRVGCSWLVVRSSSQRNPNSEPQTSTRIEDESSGTLPLGEEGRVRRSVAINALAVFFLVYVFLWNLRTVHFQECSKFFPEQVNFIAYRFGLDQMWGMFSPGPLREDGWYVVQGKLKNGTKVDVVKGGPVSWEKPELVSAIYENERWRKYLMNLCQKQHAAYRPYYAQYLLHQWNCLHGADKQLQGIEIYFMLKVTLPNYEVSRPEKVLLYEHPPARESEEADDTDSS